TVLRLEARKSCSFRLELLYANDVPLDLTGSIFSFVLAQPEHLGGNILIDEAGVLEDPENGLVRFNLQATDLELDDTEYPYAVTWINPDGYSSVVMKGSTEIIENTEIASLGYEYDLTAPPQGFTLRFCDYNRITLKLNHLPAPPGPQGIQ